MREQDRKQIKELSEDLKDYSGQAGTIEAIIFAIFLGFVFFILSKYDVTGISIIIVILLTILIIIIFHVVRERKLVLKAKRILPEILAELERAEISFEDKKNENEKLHQDNKYLSTLISIIFEVIYNDEKRQQLKEKLDKYNPYNKEIEK